MSEQDAPSLKRDYESAIVGFEFTGDQLLTGEMVPLSQGLTVLYGLNGAGKTRLLRGMRAALVGIRDDVDMGMIVRAQLPDELPDSVRHWNIDVSYTPRPLTTALAQSMTASGMHDTLSDPGSLSSEHNFTAASAKEIIDAHIRMMAGVQDCELTDELLESRFFLLVPTGTADHPAWDAWAVADLALPAAHTADMDINASYSQLDHIEGEEWTEAFDDWQEANRTRALFPNGERFIRARRRSGAQVPPRFSPYDSGWPSGDGMRGIELQGSIDFGVDILDLEAGIEVSTRQFITAVVHSLADENQYKDEEEPFTGLRDVAKYPGLSRRFSEETIQAIGANFSETVGLGDLVENTITEVATAISIIASDNLKHILPDAPRAALSITHPALRLTSPAFAWTFARAESRSQFGLDDLSRAERGWAVRAINEALHTYQRELTPPSHPLRPVITLIDEPESALHRAAESQMANALMERSNDPRTVLITATHSPELLDAQSARLAEIQRDGGPRQGQSLVHPLDFSDREALDRLGLLPSDLLRQYRVILLVEGIHDEALLQAFLEKRLRAARVHVIPLHGGAKLPATLDSQVLFEFTSAHIVGLVDNQRADVVQDVWNRAQEAATQGEVEIAKNIVLNGLRVRKLPGKKADSESDWIRTWLTKSLDAGLHSRLDMLGLSAPDIIEYLPVERLVPGVASWDELHAQHEAAKAARSPARNDFKEWLEEKLGVDFSAATLRAAAIDMPLPREFSDVMNRIEALSTRQPE